MIRSLAARFASAVASKEGAVLAAPLVLAAATVATLVAGPAPTISSAQAQTATTEATASFSPAQRTEIGQIIKQYLLEHPEVLVEVSKELEKRQAASQAENLKRVLVDRKSSIFRSAGDFVYGNPKGDVTVVEFFDYNCSWCKKAVDEMQKLVKADPNVRVVFKEFPIFGEHSVIAAKAAMAAARQNKYWELHVAMMREKQVTKDNVFRIAEKAGVNVEKLKADMADPAFDAALKENTSIAQELGIEGTPGFLIDSRVNFGFIGADGIKDVLADIRKAGCQVC